MAKRANTDSPDSRLNWVIKSLDYRILRFEHDRDKQTHTASDPSTSSSRLAEVSKVGGRGKKKLSAPSLDELELLYGDRTRKNELIVKATFSHYTCPPDVMVGFGYPIYDVEIAKFKKGKRLEALLTIHEAMGGKPIKLDSELPAVADALTRKGLVTIRKTRIESKVLGFCGT